MRTTTEINELLEVINPEMAPIYLKHEELEILGIVTGVLRMNE